MRILVLITAVTLISCGPSPEKTKADNTPVDFEMIAKGNMVDLDPYIEEGVFTVFDFYADWCPPCKKLNKSLIDMKKIYGDRMVVYKLDIVSWESELAQGFKIKDLPYLMVYDKNRLVMKAGPSNQTLPALIAALNDNS
ncbi:MAG: thioredoxin family protein [Acidobacteriota bacterium]|nr:thioredoxin family protein [Acidobacteriota bacterium]